MKSPYRIRWRVAFPFLLLHLGAIAAPWFFEWKSLGVAAVLWFATGMFGITVGYHRFLAHRAFEMGPALKAFHLFWATLAFQQGPLSWVRLHRAHHAFSDTDRDPHSQVFGFWYGHMGWACLEYPDRGKSRLAVVAPSDLKRDPVVRFFERYHLYLYLGSLLVLALVGGLSMFLWAGCFRTVFCLHAAFAVNSINHRYGYRNFETDDRSTNSWWVAFLTWGEGWHNNHHRFPQSARHGLRWWELDVSYAWISILRAMNLAREVRTVSSEEISKELADQAA